MDPEIIKEPSYCLGGIECIIKNRNKFYKSPLAQIKAIERHLKEFYKEKGWKWEDD